LRLLATYITISIVTLFALVYPLGRTFASLERGRLMRDIEHDASVVAALSEDALEKNQRPNLGSVLPTYANGPGGRIVVVDTKGRSVADSQTPARLGADFSNRSEIIAGLNGNRAEGRRHSDTLETDLLYVVVPVASSGVVHGAVRVTYPSSTLDERVRNVWIGLVLLSALVIVVVTLVGLALARLVTRPVRRLEEAARSIAAGDLTARAPTDAGAPELRELAATFNETAERLEALVDSQQSFVADASHQLRTPLAALRLQLENLESAVPIELQPDLASARAETARLSRISNTLLELTRSAGARVHCERIDVSAVAGERRDNWRAAAEEAEVTLSLEAPEHVYVSAASGAIEQMLDNLIANALEVAPTASTVQLTVRAIDTGEVELHVIDAGPGLDEEQRHRAFDRFWRGPDATPGGSGLGLAIVAQLAGQCGGRAELRRSDRGGIDAVITLSAA
jgi:signal transduction histidine kinase